MKGRTRIISVSSSEEEERRARLMIESLRSFGGPLSDCPVWVFAPRPGAPDRLSGIANVRVVPLKIEDALLGYPFADKVFACARAEEMAERDIRTLVWMNPECMTVNPPVQFDLAPSFDAAFRPVHIKNVGSPAQEPLDDFWTDVYRTVGIDNASYTVESFVDTQILRPYFNTHCFSINPSKGVLRAWGECFTSMIMDAQFQNGHCADELHKIFLHQAVLSAFVMKMMDRERIRMLPPEYSYPLHLHRELPEIRRVRAVNDLTCAVYEDARDLEALEIREPFKSWLKAHRP